MRPDGVFLVGSQLPAHEIVLVEGFCGFLEALTDPSYSGQILFFTHPNPGTHPLEEQWQSQQIQASGVIAIAPETHLLEFCKHWDLPLFQPHQPLKWIYELRTPKSMDSPQPGKLLPRASLEELSHFAGFYGNGPGNPFSLQNEIQEIQKLLSLKQPFLGICLGFELLALALELKVEKLEFSEHGSRFAVLEKPSNRIWQVAQNHGYGVPVQPLPDGWEIWFEDVRPGCIQGLRHQHLPQCAVQFHPEGEPGPRELWEKITQAFMMSHAHSASGVRPHLPLSGG